LIGSIGQRNQHLTPLKPNSFAVMVQHIASKSSNNCSYKNFSRANARDAADKALSSNTFNSGVIKRSAFLRV
jgi:hypothetical protein